MKLSMLSRKVFLVFKHYAKDGKVKHLRHEDFGDSVSDHFVRRICSRRIGKSLNTLSFQFSAVTDEHLERSVLPETLVGLNLNACREVTEKSLVQISKQCPNLEKIELYWNCRVSDFGVKRLAAACSRLTYVNFSGCKRLSDRGVIPVIESCPQIEVLNLTRLEKITDESVIAISQKLQALKELYLYANAQLTDDAFQALASEESVV